MSWTDEAQRTGGDDGVMRPSSQGRAVWAMECPWKRRRAAIFAPFPSSEIRSSVSDDAQVLTDAFRSVSHRHFARVAHDTRVAHFVMDKAVCSGAALQRCGGERNEKSPTRHGGGSGTMVAEWVVHGAHARSQA